MYLCNENKGADQLRVYRKADLRLCFRICKHQFSHDVAHIVYRLFSSYHKTLLQFLTVVVFCFYSIKLNSTVTGALKLAGNISILCKN